MATPSSPPSHPAAPLATAPRPSNVVKRLFFWLSGAGTAELEQCPEWEQRKYVAFGATVLVPTVFAFVACAYALSTIATDWRVIAPVALVWALIILTVDRALLATYRSFQGVHRKLSQFFLRFVVAILMGLTISHPLTLLLFKDTVHSAIEEEREAEMTLVRAEAEAGKQAVEKKIAAVEADIAARRADWKDSLQADFLNGLDENAATRPGDGLSEEAKAELQKRIDEATGPNQDRVAALDAEIAARKADFTKVQGEQDFWQREFEREVNGQRSGIVGLGPRAKSIRDDQLAPRRAESQRLGTQLESLTAERNQLRGVIATTEEAVTAEFLVEQSALAVQLEEKRAFNERLERKLKESQAETFVEQQNALAATIMQQIETRNEDLKRLQDEVATLEKGKNERLAAMMAEPRRDLLTQTLVLHGIFLKGDEGGRFALIAYVVLALLFMLVDTIPIVVKFFSKPGPYDTLVDCEEVRYESERKAFLQSYEAYMAELSGSRLLTATKNQPLERALVDGVDRSRVAKEFLESMMELERAFEEKMEAERRRLTDRGPDHAGSAGHAAMLEEMAEAFYADMRRRMASFFETSGGGAPAGVRS